MPWGVTTFDEKLWEALEPEYKRMRDSESSHVTGVLEWAIAYSEQTKSDLPPWMLTMDQAEAQNKLSSAIAEDDEKKLREAIVFAKQVDMKKNHELVELYDSGLTKLRQLKRLPSGWQVDELVGDDDHEAMYKKADMSGEEFLKLVQQLFDETKASILTRDRKDGPVPRGYTVKRIEQVMNAESWGSYLKRRDEVADACKAYPGEVPTSIEMWNQRSGPIKTMHQAPRILEHCKMPPVVSAANEFVLFHGTKPEAADLIAKNHFDMAFACSAGLFGGGLYFAESCSKADEYVKPNSANEYPMLMVRCTLGHVNYLPQLNPLQDPGKEAMEQSCFTGTYHSVLGDRIKARGTYREFVIYDHYQVYPHLIIWYERL